jgi:DNA polymerase III subunit delta'
MIPIDIIKRSLLKDQLSHLYLLIGNQGDYRDQMILEIVQTLVLDSISNKAELIEKQKVMWVESETQVIKKEQIQELFTEFSKTSLQNQRKVYVIEDAEKLNISSANTLLKFMEEPDSKTSVGILVTNNQQSLLDTIVSRSHILKIAEPSMKERKETFQSLELNSLEIEIFSVLYQDKKDVLEALENPLIQEMIVLFKHIVIEKHNKNFIYDVYELSGCLNEKQTLISFLQILFRYFTDLKTDPSHIHFQSLTKNIQFQSEHIDALQLEEILQSIQSILKQMRYFVQNELQKRHVLHLIKEVFQS